MSFVVWNLGLHDENSISIVPIILVPLSSLHSLPPERSAKGMAALVSTAGAVRGNQSWTRGQGKTFLL